MKKTLPLIGMLIAVALVPSIIGALLGTKGTGAFVIDFLLFGPIIPIAALSIILWLLGKEPQESPRPAEEADKEDEEEEPAPPAPKEQSAEEPIEPDDEESAAEETEEESDKKASEEAESLCPTCGATCPLEDTFCPHCGAEFEDEEDEGKKD